jgi:2-dehydro-3-deoxygluconokinase
MFSVSQGHIGFAAFGELMARLNCPKGQRLQQAHALNLSFGGAEANVCVLLSRLGIRSKFVSRLPENDLGIAARDSLRQQGVDTNALLYGGNKLGLYFTEDGNLIRSSRVIYDREHSSFSELAPGMIPWDEILSESNWFHWSGVGPALSRQMAAVYLEALEAASKMGLLISADLNYRSTLWNYGDSPSKVMGELLSFCEVITGDLDAAQKFLDISTSEQSGWEERFAQGARQMQLKLPKLKTLAMSFRNVGPSTEQSYSGALFDGHESHYSKIYYLPNAIDRIGSGDAFAAGLIYAMGENLVPREALSFATACGVLKHSLEGDFALLSLEEIKSFIHTGPSGRLIR